MNKISLVYDWLDELATRPQLIREHYSDSEISSFAKMALDALRKPSWIPVTERLPRSMANKVLVYLQHEEYVPYIGYGHYEKFKGEEIWYDLENNVPFSERGYTVTHWLPVPESSDGEELVLY